MAGFKVNFLTATNDDDTASINNEGKIRYRTVSGNSYIDMVMKISDNVYEWVNILRHEW